MIKGNKLIKDANPIVIWVHIAIKFALKIDNILGYSLRRINKISSL